MDCEIVVKVLWIAAAVVVVVLTERDKMRIRDQMESRPTPGR